MPANMLDALTIETLKRLQPEAKLRAALRLWHSARELKAAAIRAQQPALPEAEIWRRVRECFLHARD